MPIIPSPLQGFSAPLPPNLLPLLRRTEGCFPQYIGLKGKKIKKPGNDVSTQGSDYSLRKHPHIQLALNQYQAMLIQDTLSTMEGADQYSLLSLSCEPQSQGVPTTQLIHLCFWYSVFCSSLQSGSMSEVSD